MRLFLLPPFTLRIKKIWHNHFQVCVLLFLQKPIKDVFNNFRNNRLPRSHNGFKALKNMHSVSNKRHVFNKIWRNGFILKGSSKFFINYFIALMKREWQDFALLVSKCIKTRDHVIKFDCLVAWGAFLLFWVYFWISSFPLYSMLFVFWYK